MGQKMEIKCYKWFGSHARDVEVSSDLPRSYATHGLRMKSSRMSSRGNTQVFSDLSKTNIHM